VESNGCTYNVLVSKGKMPVERLLRHSAWKWNSCWVFENDVTTAATEAHLDCPESKSQRPQRAI